MAVSAVVSSVMTPPGPMTGGMVGGGYDHRVLDYPAEILCIHVAGECIGRGVRQAHDGGVEIDHVDHLRRCRVHARYMQKARANSLCVDFVHQRLAIGNDHRHTYAAFIDFRFSLLPG